MKKFVEKLMAAMRQFSVLDFAIFKIAMFATGVFVGMWFVFELIDYLYIILGVAIFAILYTCFKMIKYICCQR